MASEEVAKHYNTLEEKGLAARSESRIFYLRNFNNWIKSMLIGDFIRRIRNDSRSHGQRNEVVALDMCCGKGGDLLKWKKGEIDHLVCADIAEVSLEQCKDRYNDMAYRGSRERRPAKQYTAEFIHADCSRVRLRDRYENPNVRFDISSVQFSLHYSFASASQAKCMLRNACENLKPGGYFVGTIPNADWIVRMVTNNDGVSFKNEVSAVRFDEPIQTYGLFGAKYDFSLEEVVNCPEYLVYFPLLVEMLKEFDMELVYKKTFPEMVDAHAHGGFGKDLLARMQGLEAYPADDDVRLMGVSAQQYVDPQKRLEDLKKRESDQHRDSRRPTKMGTLSKSEWEAAIMYLAFAFRKKTSGHR